MKIFNPFLFILFPNSKPSSKVVRLDKQEDKTSIDNFCEKIAPYVLFFALVIFSILILVVLVKYGATITGTEANAYYNGNWR